MRRLLPQNLSGQLALVLCAALLVASAVNVAFIVSERTRSMFVEASERPMARFATLYLRVARSAGAGDLNDGPIEDDGPGPDPDRGGPAPRGEGLFGPGPPPQEAGEPGADDPQRGPGERRFREVIMLGSRGRIQVAPVSLVDRNGLERDSRLERRLARALAEEGAGEVEVRAAHKEMTFARQSWRAAAWNENRPPMPPEGGGPQREEFVLSARLADGRWLNASFSVNKPPVDEIWRLLASTLVLFAAVLGAALWTAGRISRPLRDLADAAGRVGAAQQPQQLKVTGPSDVRATLEAFNAMSRRVDHLLTEKDVMLGALGHDLRTPLASLRIRVETMEPVAERDRAVQTIEETARLLDDILELARRGRSAEPARPMDLAVLAADLVDDYRDAGLDVAGDRLDRAPAAVRPMLLRRAIRNLVDNALKYGGSARLSTRLSDGMAMLEVVDAGPGMTAEEIAIAFEPFQRGDASRNRATGGAGLGLALARAIAESHGGAIELAAVAPQGLRATLKLPQAQV